MALIPFEVHPSTILDQVLLFQTQIQALLIEELLAGKRAFIAGVADDNGYGWAIAKSLAAAGAEILVGTWVPVRTFI